MDILDDPQFVGLLTVARDDLSQSEWLRDKIPGTDNWTLVVALESVLTGESVLEVRAVHGGDPQSWVYVFFREFCTEIRTIICDKRASTAVGKSTGFSAKAATTALAAWMTQHFGCSEPFAIGGAAVVLLVLMEATRGAFCKMTDSAVEFELKEE